MKVVESNNRSVTAKLSRREIADLSDTLTLAVGVLLERGLRHKDERFLPRVQALQQHFTQIAITKSGYCPRGHGCALIRNFVSDRERRSETEEIKNHT